MPVLRSKASTRVVLPWSTWARAGRPGRADSVARCGTLSREQTGAALALRALYLVLALAGVSARSAGVENHALHAAQAPV
mgnify:CR=1 FL=1